MNDGPDVGERPGAAEPGAHHEVRAPALFAIRHLLGEDGVELRPRHPRPRERADGLQVRGRARHHGEIAAPETAAFEEKRDVQQRRGLAAPAGVRQKARLGPLHTGMEDRFQAPQRRAVAEDGGAELLAVDAGLDTADVGKGREHRRHRLAPRRHQIVHREVGVEDGPAEGAEHRGRRRLAHGDRAGEADDHHLSRRRARPGRAGRRVRPAAAAPARRRRRRGCPRARAHRAPPSGSRRRSPRAPHRRRRRSGG